MIKANQLLLQIETEPSQKRDCDSNVSLTVICNWS